MHIQRHHARLRRSSARQQQMHCGIWTMTMGCGMLQQRARTGSAVGVAHASRGRSRRGHTTQPLYHSVLKNKLRCVEEQARVFIMPCGPSCRLTLEYPGGHLAASLHLLLRCVQTRNFRNNISYDDLTWRIRHPPKRGAAQHQHTPSVRPPGPARIMVSELLC